MVKDQLSGLISKGRKTLESLQNLVPDSSLVHEKNGPSHSKSLHLPGEKVTLSAKEDSSEWHAQRW